MVECGPMRLMIDARRGKVPLTQEALEAARKAVGFLEGVARSRPFLGRDYARWISFITDPLAQRMVASVRLVGDEDLTPMAAVAGTIADGVANFLLKRGATRVLIDNGGDVAVRCQDDRPVTVGVKSRVDSIDISQSILLGPERESWGIATSGVGGRSLTRGVVDAATVVAADASLADAAATAIANASFISCPGIIRCAAEKIDPYTDITGLEVTTKVGPVGENEIQQAIKQAIERAESLCRKKVILGALVTFRGRMAMTPFIAERLRTIS